jgi:2-polyprenyl-6-methoxyphenol hydroxylase-like FAD-dependent oxidoreductase
VRLYELTSARPYVTYEKEGSSRRIDCDYIAGCDGQHGVCRSLILIALVKTYEKSYPFGWLGIMSETPPFPDLCYCYHRRGFALASMRTPMLSRYYIQCDLNAKLEEWPGRAHVLVADDVVAPLSRRDPVRGADAAEPVRLSTRLRARAGVFGGTICLTAF